MTTPIDFRRCSRSVEQVKGTQFAAMVLAAGFGTRLAPLTNEVPKPLVPIGNRPLLLQILETLHEAGATQLAINTHYKNEKISSEIKELQIKVHVSHEETILGTAGGVAYANRVLNASSLILVNGDIFGGLPVRQLLDAADLGLTMAVTACALGSGTVGMGDDGRIVRLRGQVFGEEVASGNYMGMAHLGRQCLSDLPQQGCLVGDYALKELRAGGRVGTVVVDDDFIDVGSVSEYWRANMRYLAQRVERGLNDSLIAQRASVAPFVQLRQSVVGEGARITGTGLVEECVVLPGGQLEAPARRLVVSASGHTINVADLGSPIACQRSGD